MVKAVRKQTQKSKKVQETESDKGIRLGLGHRVPRLNSVAHNNNRLAGRVVVRSLRYPLLEPVDIVLRHQEYHAHLTITIGSNP